MARKSAKTDRTNSSKPADRQRTALNAKRISSANLNALRDFDSLPDSAYVRQPVVERVFGYSGSTVWRRVKDGGLSGPDILSPGVTGFQVGKLRADLRKRASAPKASSSSPIGRRGKSTSKHPATAA